MTTLTRYLGRYRYRKRHSTKTTTMEKLVPVLDLISMLVGSGLLISWEVSWIT